MNEYATSTATNSRVCPTCKGTGINPVANYLCLPQVPRRDTSTDPNVVQHAALTTADPQAIIPPRLTSCALKQVEPS